jgi:hypothetical protein
MLAPEIPAEAAPPAVADAATEAVALLRPDLALHDFCLLLDDVDDEYGADTAVLGAA